MPDVSATEPLHEATQRLVRTVDALPPDAWAGPSLLPGWSRAHVVAHLTLNAEGLAGALAGVVAEEAVPMYASQEARDADIDELATHDVADLRDRMFASTTTFADAFAAVPEDRLSVTIERTPGSDRTFPAGAAETMRWREVEIHHADLASSYDRSSWPAPFLLHLVETASQRPGVPGGLVLQAVDLDHRWTTGDPDTQTDPVTVSGLAADLGWWLTGRGTGEGLTVDRGELPQIGAF
jgi:maleylpyruvate isomerase